MNKNYYGDISAFSLFDERYFLVQIHVSFTTPRTNRTSPHLRIVVSSSVQNVNCQINPFVDLSEVVLNGIN